MSYVTMDHAGWVEENIAAGKKMASKADQRRALQQQRGWCAAPEVLNDFQRRAVTILGIVGNGIYNAPIAWHLAWWHPKMLSVSWHHEMATFDFTALTSFVFQCHEARIRGGIAAKGPKTIELHLAERAATGGVSKRHPDLDEAIAEFRRWFPADHSLVYRKPAEPVA